MADEVTNPTFPDPRHDDVVELGERLLVLAELHVVEVAVPRHVRPQSAVLHPVALARLEEGQALLGALCDDDETFSPLRRAAL